MHRGGPVLWQEPVPQVSVLCYFVEVDLHNVVITLLYLTEIQNFIYHWIPC